MIKFSPYRFLKRCFRMLCGWCLGSWFVLMGKRLRCLKRYDVDGNVLSLFTHNPHPDVLEGVLSWLKKRGFTFVTTDDLLAIKIGRREWAKHLAWFTLENHTYSHLLCRSRPVEEIREEVAKTQAILTEWTGREPRLVCYPFGHYTQEVDEAMRKKGLVPVHSHVGVMNIKTIESVRNMFTETMSNLENIGRILGAWVRVNEL